MYIKTDYATSRTDSRIARRPIAATGCRIFSIRPGKPRKAYGAGEKHHSALAGAFQDYPDCSVPNRFKGRRFPAARTAS